MYQLRHIGTWGTRVEGGDGLRRLLLCCGLEGPEDARCGALDARTGCLDPGDGLVAATGPACDVAEGVLAAVDPERLGDDVCRGLGFQLGERPTLELLVEQGVVAGLA